MKLVNLSVILIGLSLLTACASVDEGGSVMARSTSPFIPVGAIVDAPRGYVDMCRDRPVLCVDGRRMATNAAAPPASPARAGSPSQAAKPADATGALAVPTAAPSPASGLKPKPVLEATWDAARPTMAAATLGDLPPVTVEGRRLPISTRLRLLESVDRYVNANVRQATDMEVYGVQEYWNRSGVGPGARGDCEDLAIEKRLELIDQGYPAADLVYAVVYRPDLGLHAVLVAHTEIGDLVLDSRTPEIVLWNHAPYTWIKRQSPEDPSIWNLVDPDRPLQPVLRVASLEGESPAGPTADAPLGAR